MFLFNNNHYISFWHFSDSAQHSVFPLRVWSVTIWVSWVLTLINPDQPLWCVPDYSGTMLLHSIILRLSPSIPSSPSLDNRSKVDNGAFIEVDGWIVEIFRGSQPHNIPTLLFFLDSENIICVSFILNIPLGFLAISIQPRMRKDTDLAFCIHTTMKVPQLSTRFIILCL